jgi:hypothetical protein
MRAFLHPKVKSENPANRKQIFALKQVTSISKGISRSGHFAEIRADGT